MSPEWILLAWKNIFCYFVRFNKRRLHVQRDKAQDNLIKYEVVKDRAYKRLCQLFLFRQIIRAWF